MGTSAGPIKFRCFKCGALLGVARVKAGAVVACPRCGLDLIVPEPPDEPDQPRTVEINEPPMPTAPISAPTPPPPPTEPPPPASTAPTDPEAPILPVQVDPPLPIRPETSSRLLDRPTTPRARDVIVPRAALLAWSLFALLALALAFVAGLLVGHFVWHGRGSDGIASIRRPAPCVSRPVERYIVI